ncbi:MAG: dihydropteroate synthase [Candidatus Westeberhardia cardiocondylae]|nr:dihydropteroate synthase [Candidatus Westeberhardia cardiocondylae]
MKLIISNNKKVDLTFPKVMGILNVTPDSFFDGGKYNKVSCAVDRVFYMIKNGATFIDIGGESTRPGSDIVEEEEEMDRVIPIIEALASRFDTIISVNTSRTLVMKQSLLVGAHLINDVRCFSEKGSLDVISKFRIPICLVHMKGTPKTMQRKPNYNNIVSEIKDFFSEKISYFELHGINKSKLLLDPGFGFGKTVSHNYDLLSNLKEFNCFELPILVGMSRKSMISKFLNVSFDKCMLGSITCAVIAAMQGAKIIRTHDVKETMDALHIVSYILKKSNKFNNKDTNKC